MYIIIIIMHVRAALCIATELSSEHTCHCSRFHHCTRQLTTGFRCHWKSGPNRNARLNLPVHRPSPSLGRRRLLVAQVTGGPDPRPPCGEQCALRAATMRFPLVEWSPTVHLLQT